MPDTQPPRGLPYLDQNNRAFWSSGEHGLLRIYQCRQCQHYIHPPVGFCPCCESREVGPQTVSGRGKIISFTINHKQWVPALTVPYVLALVGINEQPKVQLPTNIVNCEPTDVFIGMAVKVLFEQAEDIWVPLFEPDRDQ